MALKKCQKCGATFTCDGDNDCWCEKVDILKKEMIQLMEKYTDCLCPQCLSKYAEK